MGDLVTGKALDDRVGVYVMLEGFRTAGASRMEVHATATAQEEVGLRGAHTSAFGIDPKVGIAVDVCHATDHPDMDKRRVGAIKLGAGPVIARQATWAPDASPRGNGPRAVGPGHVADDPGDDGRRVVAGREVPHPRAGHAYASIGEGAHRRKTDRHRHLRQRRTARAPPEDVGRPRHPRARHGRQRPAPEWRSGCSCGCWARGCIRTR